MIRFHKKETKGQGINGSTVNSHWIDISYNGQAAGYIFKSIGSTYFDATILFDGVNKSQKFTSLKAAKEFARTVLAS